MIDIDRIARLVAGRIDITATQKEQEIAKQLRRIGERMEREGFLPSMRRAHMLRLLHDEARLSQLIDGIHEEVRPDEGEIKC
jgi:hypothetical protein